jgi:hypothetical protein
MKARGLTMPNLIVRPTLIQFFKDNEKRVKTVRYEVLTVIEIRLQLSGM